MAAVLSKRQQARNERALQELIKTVPGNDRCADCEARNPGWASWSLGVFLCMRCAALHRKLGTHISKVKSLSMDSWSNEQVDNMRKMGNVNSNRTYNPQNAKPSIPIDVDEVDGAMERFIRQKYETRVFSGGASRPGTRHNTGSTSSAEDQPPPLPPKPAKRFDFSLRSSSSTFPTTRNQAKADMESPPASAGLSGFGERSSTRTNKPSRIFGTSIDRPSGDSFEQKLGTLREMGFADERRNSTVLKGHDGNLDRAVESLIRIDGASKPASRAETPGAAVNGITVEKKRGTPTATNQSNPFERLDQQQPQQQTAPFQQLQQPQVNGNFYPQPTSHTNPYNPFHVQQQEQVAQAPSFEQSFQNMAISPSQQQLFPNNTGGFAAPGLHQQTNPFLKTFTPPPVSQIPQSYDQYPSQQFSQQQYPQQTAQPAAGNPFLRTSRSQVFSSSNPFGQHLPTQPTFMQLEQSNQQQPLYQQQQTPSQQLPFPQQTQQQQQTPTPQLPFPQQIHQQPSSFHNPYFAQQTQSPQQPYQQPLLNQPTGAFRHDKNSILALYSYPQPGVQRPATIAENEPFHSDPSNSAAIQGSVLPMPAANPNVNGMSASAGVKRAVTMPLQAKNNPFAAQANGMAPGGVMSSMPGTGLGNVGGGSVQRHVSNESVDFTALGSGRHSPDAFAGLSARSGR
ncbi:MAG: hypothetical protein M1822_003245 [Bathelium mastoideum]|nr:MAG: hypothetical protein M1822_003245 [Bathelium mastoideum]